MDSQPAKPKFVSSIPNNTLEPVFLGAPSGSQGSKGSGKYVPGFLRNKDNDTDVSGKKTDSNVVPENNLDNFPTLAGTIWTKPGSTLNFAEAIKKPSVQSDLPKLVTRENMVAVSKKKRVKVRNDSEDYDDEDDY
jgi:hypothetical protein